MRLPLAGRRVQATPHLLVMLFALIAAIALFCVGNRNALGQEYGQPCPTCEQNKYNCDVQAEWDYQQCRRDHPNNPDDCEESHQAKLLRCEDEYNACSASCNPATSDPTHEFPPGCTDNSVGGLTNLESNGYISGWAMDGDSQSYNNCVMVEFSVDRIADLWNPPEFGGCAILRIPPGSGQGFSIVVPSRYRDGQAHTIYGYTWDPCYGRSHFFSGSPRTFILDPGNPTDDQHTFVRQLYIDYYQRPPDQPGWDQWTSAITACGSDAGCIVNQRGHAAASFFDSNEYMGWGAVPEVVWIPKGTSAYNEAFVSALYKTLLRRDPDEAGYNNWLNVLNSYGSPTPAAAYDAVAAAFTESAEYRNRFY